MGHKLTAILDRRLVLSIAIIFSIFVMLPPQTRAALVESRTADGQTISQRAADLETVRSMLEQDVVIQKLTDYGYSKEEALARIQGASDEQLHQLASLSDDLVAGGDGLGIIVTVLVIVLLVILILKLNDNRIIVK